MSKSSRLIELIMYINNKHRFTVKEAADEFGVSYRTILRDLHELSGLGVPLYSEVGVHGGYYILRERALPPILFLESEAVAMFFANHSLQFFGALPFDVEIRSVLNKFQNYLPKDVQHRIDEMKDRIMFWNPDRTEEIPFLKLLLEAAIENECLNIKYDSHDSQADRVIQPIGIYSYNGFWYCPAYCYKREDYRLFRADRILLAEKTSPPNPPFNGKRLTVHEWLYANDSDEDLLPLKIRLTREGVRRLQSDLYLGEYIQKKNDGTGTIEHVMSLGKIDYIGEILWTIGENAFVEEPVELKNYLKDKIKRFQSIYL